MSRIRKAVIPAAGWGTRFLPIVKALPKTMLPIIDKPPIHYAVEDAVAAGCEIIYIIVAKGQEAIQWYFGRSLELERVLEKKNRPDLRDQLVEISNKAEIVYLIQQEQKGLGHAINCAKNHIGDENFHVLLGDDIIVNPNGISSSKQLALAHKKYNAPVFAVLKVPREDISKFGIINGTSLGSVNLSGNGGKPVNVYKVNELVEKPKPEQAPSDLAIMGRYLFPPEIFDHIKKTKPGVGGEIQITDAMNSLNKEMGFVACEFEGIRYDLGNKVDWLIANIEIAMGRKETRDGIKEYFNSPRFKERLELVKKVIEA